MLRLSPTLYREISNWLSASPHIEVCGFLGGRQGIAQRLYPVCNVAAWPGTSFRMEAEGQARALHTIEGDGLHLMALIHSHPAGHLALPGEEDRGGAAGFSALTMVIGAAGWGGGMAACRAFRLDNHDEVPLWVTSVSDQGA